MRPPTARIGDVLHATYRIDRLIGRGGGGAVFEASHLRLPRRYAIKLLSPALAKQPNAVARFQREAAVTTELGHPNIVEVFDFYQTDDGIPYFVMELLAGESLAARLGRAPLPSLDDVTAILEQTASALQAAHDMGVIHRDLKPDNIYLCPQKNEATPLVKVMDFGISKVLSSVEQLTAAHVVLGTPHYMAPEQLGSSAEADERTDIYALGVIIYQMLCGRVPFEAEELRQIYTRVALDDPPPLIERNPAVSPAIADVVHRALSKKKPDRQQTMRSLLEDFHAARASSLDPTEKVRPRPALLPLPATSIEPATIIEPSTTTHTPPPLDQAARELARAARSARQARTRTEAAIDWNVPPAEERTLLAEPATRLQVAPGANPFDEPPTGEFSRPATPPAEVLVDPEELPDTNQQRRPPSQAIDAEQPQSTEVAFAAVPPAKEAPATLVARRSGLPRPLLLGAIVGLLALASVVAFCSLGSGGRPTTRDAAGGPRAPDIGVTKARVRILRTADASSSEATSDSAPSTADTGRPDATERPDAATERPKPRAPRRKRPTGTGFLTVVTAEIGGRELWANVLLDGKTVGRSVIYKRPVRAGRHTVEVRRPGFAGERRRVFVRRDQEKRVLLRLRRRSAP